MQCVVFRKDTKTLFLRNTTLLPVQWRLSGLENLGDDFSMSQESGIIAAKSEFQLHSYFRALKPMSTSKKAVRLEVCFFIWLWCYFSMPNHCVIVSVVKQQHQFVRSTYFKTDFLISSVNGL